MKKKPTVIMAERSDIYQDARVQKEATSLANNNYKVEVWGFRGTWKKEKVKYNFKLVTFPVVSRRFRILRNIHMALNIFIISLVILWKKAEYYHAHNTMFLPAMYLSSRIHKGKFIYDSHEVQWELNRLVEFLEKAFIQRADRVINVSKGRAEAQSERYDVPKNKITVISNYPVTSSNTLEFEQNSNDAALHCIFSGGFSLKNNRLDNLLLAIKERPKIKFSLLSFGYGKSQDDLKRIIRQFDLNERVTFLPLVQPDRVIETISHYDFAVNLLTNHNNMVTYNFPAINKMYEYMAAGLPVLVSRLRSFIDEFEKQGIGIAVDPDNVDSIKEGLDFFLENRDAIKTMKRKALELSRDRYNWETQEKKLLALYEDLAFMNTNVELV